MIFQCPNFGRRRFVRGLVDCGGSRGTTIAGMAQVDSNTDISEPISPVVSPCPELNTMKRVNLVGFSEAVAAESLSAEAFQTTP